MLKTLTRITLFTASALYVTALWNKGFVIGTGLHDFLQATFIFSVIHYVIKPISKLVLLPINILTLGVMNLILYVVLFYFFSTRVPSVAVRQWHFTGANVMGYSLPERKISYPANLVLSSASISGIIRILDTLL